METGGKGGDSCATYRGIADIIQSGLDGGDGESCGKLFIHDTITVYAYGGAGGSGGVYLSTTGSSGTGGGGYPAAGIGRRWCWSEVGADHMNGAGGYSAGLGELVSDNTQVHNGLYDNEPLKHSERVTGGSYFCAGRFDATESHNIYHFIGGGGCAEDHCFRDSGGDGGLAGKGGKIIVEETATVYAFNGNRITDDKFDYDKTIVKDISDTGEILQTTQDVLMKQDGTKFIETKIYAQNGILRPVYKNNSWWGVKENYNYEYFLKLFKTDLVSDVKNIVICNGTLETRKYYLIRDRKEDTNLKTSYINPLTGDCYGIGSGAGYIELSNGTYEVDSALN